MKLGMESDWGLFLDTQSLLYKNLASFQMKANPTL